MRKIFEKQPFVIENTSIIKHNYNKSILNKSLEVTKEIKRNDICPCGSGKKAKNCCGAKKEYKKVAQAIKKLI